MEIAKTRVVLRERTVTEVTDLAVRFIVANAGLYARLAVVVLPAFYLPTWLVARSAGALASWTLAVVLAPVACAPFTVLASRAVFEDRVGVWPTLATALGALPRLFFLRVVEIAAAALGLVLVIPTFWVLTSRMFFVEVALLEGEERSAFARSAQIVRRASNGCFIALLLFMLLYAVVPLLVDEAGRMIISVLLEAEPPASVWEDGTSSLALAGFWLLMPVLTTARFFLYLDARTRSEGWDIQARFMALGRDDEPSVQRRAA